MKLGYTILYVADVRASVQFYEQAFGLTLKFMDESASFAELDTGSTSLAFCSRALLQQLGKTPAAPQLKAPCFEIALVTEDVPAAMARAVGAGAQALQEPQRMEWGQTVAYVADPEGFTVELCTPMG
ncbi:VOC family protein [Roseateles sp. BYS180W]|uniref:VOC family protein n=1 Tax=Roseateles rivi TaxID=3299028 RepID=A0ABW7FYW5_9BURK